MVDFVFNLLESIGFTHPLHPAFTHIPMGMAIGGFVFALVAFLFKIPQLYKSSYYCSILGLVGVPPTVISGILDWQHNYGGEWLTPIKIKLVMATLITILLVAAVYVGRDAEKSPVKFLMIYLLIMISAINLGFWGGDLIFG